MLHFLCAACERRGKQSMAATPAATFPALATRIPSAHLFTHAQFAQTTHTRSGNKTNAHSHASIQPSKIAYAGAKGTYVNQINIYCSLCMVENLMNIRQAHHACVANMNEDIIYTEERHKLTRLKHTCTICF